jgi:peroxiredoxin
MPAPGSQAARHRPGRKPLSRRQRQVFAITLALALVITLGVAVLLATTTPTPPPRAVTLPAADRNAPPALVRAAEAVGFYPVAAPGTGSIENAPAAAANPTSSTDLLPVGTEAPPFTLKTPAGKAVSLSEFRGKAVLLEIFATWCPHCAAEAPHLRELANSLPASKYAFVSIDGSGADAPSVFAYHVFFGLPFPALLDPDPNAPAVTFPAHGPTGPVSRAYHTTYFPTFYVIDPKGRITWRSDGEQPDALLRQELRRAAGM